MAKTPDIKVPASLAACADRLYALEHDLDGKRAKAKAIIDALDAEYDALTAHLIDELPKAQATQIGGKQGLVERKTKQVPTAESWDLFWAKFNPKKDRDLLQKRLSTEACNLRWDEHKAIPGVKPFPKVYLSIRKA